ncbi:MAG: PQQ-dependent dehydrogenase, methanol/ethanol family [Gammaproteobacteria bacterium]|nr:PQQ-dependent dehydrogenase, methanol/ethanol family [Gammaproteobacteria bacterium]
MKPSRLWARALFLFPTVWVVMAAWSEEAAEGGTSAALAEATRPPGWVDEARVIAAGEAEPGSWLAHGQTYDELRFSTLTQINRDTVGILGLAWVKNLDNPFRQQATPLVIDGVMYFTDPWSVAYAVDAKTGEEIWRFDPETDRSSMRYSCCGGPANRGMAAYKGKLYFATFDARLVAVDQATGEKVWDVDTTHYPTNNPYTITGAPRAVHGLVFIGQSSSEFGLRGHLSAYDADTGELAWRFFTVPGDPSKPFEHPELEEAAKTWSGEWWKLGGGGTVWHSIVYDAKFDQLLFGTGNGAPWPRKIRSPGGGDNLFLGGVMSVNANTGRMNWFYQMTPADNWDFNACQDIALLDMEIDGKVRSVLLQGPKNGFFYVLDRENGELLRANPYVRLNWATHIDMDTGRPVENPEMAYDEKAQWVLPSNAGGHSWQAMAVDPNRGIAYLPVQDMAAWYGLPQSFLDTGEYELNPDGISLGVDMRPHEDAPPRPAASGYLKAIDPLTGEEVWSVQRATPYNGGALATAGGLVFQGDNAGQLAAYDADNGSLLWEYDTRGNTPASPITYEIEGEQYLAVLVGRIWRREDSDGRLMVFKLGAEEGEVTPEQIGAADIPEPPPLTVSEQDVGRGEVLYNRTCVGCHGIGAVATINADLRMMSGETHERFQDIVRGGVLADKGMLSFAAAVNEEEAELIRQYVISEALKARAAPAQGGERRRPGRD